jgi:hypothetical protein
MHMGKTSTEVKQRWIDKTYKRIMVSLREDSATDKRLLEFLEDYKDELGGTTQIFREALDQYITDNFPYYGKE